MKCRSSTKAYLKDNQHKLPGLWVGMRVKQLFISFCYVLVFRQNMGKKQSELDSGDSNSSTTLPHCIKRKGQSSLITL